MEINISNPDKIPWWLIFEMLEEVSYQYPDLTKIVPYRAQFGREGRVYELELKDESNAIVTKATKER